MLPRLLVGLACLLLAEFVLAREPILLDTPQGTLKGIISNTIQTKQTFYTFHGIRYAKPITQSTRFKAGEPPEPWTGVYDATFQQDECTKYCTVREMVIGEDDCLFLNVYTPDISKDAGKAVMVWVHTGWFNVGSAERHFYGPDYLVENDIILVNMEFRLGVFGFISTEDSAAPGNVGLKDQTLALKWVQNNIKYFGGDPSRVTIVGDQSGGASALYHMMSPMSAGLFVNAISQSGPVAAPWSITYRPREAAFKLGKKLGIETTDSTVLMKELEKISSTDITEARLAVDKVYKEENLNSAWYAFVPCVEPDVGQEIFLPADPWELMKAGKLADVPFLTGLAMNESLYRKKDLERADFMNENFYKFFPNNLNVSDAGQIKQISDMMKKFYLGDKPITKDSVMEYANLMSDVMFVSPTLIPLTIINSLKSSPTFNYLFAFQAEIGLYKDILDYYDLENGLGAVHMDDIDYLFYISLFRSKPEPGTPRDKMTRLMTKLWTNFAKTGNPTPVLDDVVTMKWEPMGKERNYAILNGDLTMGKKLFEERVNFWVSIYKDTLGDYAKLF